jgi:hypothetical protein
VNVGIIKIYKKYQQYKFDGLDAPESRFLSHKLVPYVTDKLTNKKKQYKSFTYIKVIVTSPFKFKRKKDIFMRFLLIGIWAME